MNADFLVLVGLFLVCPILLLLVIFSDHPRVSSILFIILSILAEASMLYLVARALQIAFSLT